MLNRRIAFSLSLIFCLLGTTVFSQVLVTGEVTDVRGTPLVGANVSLNTSDQFSITNTEGKFELQQITEGLHLLTISHLGFKTGQWMIDVSPTDSNFPITLEDDLLNLQTVVITGTFEPRSQLESNTAVATLGSRVFHQSFPRGTAELLQNIPGTFVDAAAGEVFTKVYSRGISASAEDDIGWYYVSLQEDGLPISLVQHSYYTPEIFHRLDLTTIKVEAIRGGSASITALNAPGGIYNFISSGPRDQFGGEVELQGGLQGESNPISRVDITLGGPLGNNWFYNAGGHYRRDEGARNVDFTFSKGGQFRFNAIKKNDAGYIKFSGKILDDFTNRWTGVAASNWNDPQAAFDQDFGTTSLLMPAFNANIPDGRTIGEGGSNSFDPSRGVHAQDFAFGVDVSQELGSKWSFRYNTRVSHKEANWQTSISNAFVSLDNPLAYFISGAGFPVGQVVFRDAQSGSELARVNNSGILSGDPIQYLGNGTLPNDAIMGTSAWFKDNEADEWINQLSFRKKLERHDITLGLAAGFSDISLYTQGSFAYVTYEPNPRMLQVTLENPNEPVIALSDASGVSNYGGLFFINSEANVSQLSAFVNDRWKISKKFHLDLGLRYESITHNGSKDRFAPLNRDGGVDGNENTAYDSGLLVPTGQQDLFDFNYNYLSYSVGLNYKLQKELALFTRFSTGNKAPELDYYFNNFSNVPINQKGEVQEIIQAELGIKFGARKFSFTGTAFWSQLRNIGVSNFEFDGKTNTVFYTPVQFNTSTTLGLEWDAVYTPVQNITFGFNGTIQNPKTTTWTIYDAQGTVNTNDDIVNDFSDNIVPFNPKLMFNLSGEYRNQKTTFFLKWLWMGEREGNVANAFQLPSYSVLNGGLSYAINNHWSAHLLVTNVLNSEGLVNFFGANSFGANANGANEAFIQANPDASFVVVPTLPRGTMLKLNYKF